jgi:hypothetical protein
MAFRIPKPKDGRDGRDGVDGKDGRDGERGYQGIRGERGPAGRDGIDGQDGKDGEQGPPGRDGAPGRDGKDGERGPMPDHEWDGTRLRFQKPDGEWGQLVDLKGPKGSRGDQGPSGGGGAGVGAYIPKGGTAGQVLVKTGPLNYQAEWQTPSAGAAETGPAFTYTDGVVSRIDYDSGNYKLFTYTDGAVTRIDYVRPGTTTIRKDFTYNLDGSLASIDQSEV